ncbi:hypothetical protein L596_013115 [Steinernema carpocapsae]|uniref:Uncharacterized protein n=1 Tax=Steinernema carpocapsae TaxID=34508 RepID=A0A4U5NZ93_STECR|nr:hypothetical protein L596_013115 [Steinernema carpocapsae]
MAVGGHSHSSSHSSSRGSSHSRSSSRGFLSKSGSGFFPSSSHSSGKPFGLRFISSIKNFFARLFATPRSTHHGTSTTHSKSGSGSESSRRVSNSNTVAPSPPVAQKPEVPFPLNCPPPDLDKMGVINNALFAGKPLPKNLKDPCLSANFADFSAAMPGKKDAKNYLI